MKRWIKVVEVIREVSPEETKNEEINSNAWEFRGIEVWEEIVEVEGQKPKVGEIIDLFSDDFLLSLFGPVKAEVIEVIREIEPNVWEVRVRREVESTWLLEGIRPEEGQILDTEEYIDSLWLVISPPLEEYKHLWIAVRPRFYFEKRMKEGL